RHSQALKTPCPKSSEERSGPEPFFLALSHKDRWTSCSPAAVFHRYFLPVSFPAISSKLQIGMAHASTQIQSGGRAALIRKLQSQNIGICQIGNRECGRECGFRRECVVAAKDRKMIQFPGRNLRTRGIKCASSSCASPH